MNAYVALLRGVNVGGKHPLPMKQLARLFTEAGCDDVRTYIQSGNVVFRSSETIAAGFSTLMTAEIKNSFGIVTPVLVRSAKEMKGVMESNPFIKAESPEASLHVYFLAAEPAKEAVSKLDPLRSSPDAFVVQGREIYLQLPNGMARTKLTNNYFDTKLQTISTARNWRTVTKLFEMLQG